MSSSDTDIAVTREIFHVKFQEKQVIESEESTQSDTTSDTASGMFTKVLTKVQIMILTMIKVIS